LQKYIQPSFNSEPKGKGFEELVERQTARKRGEWTISLRKSVEIEKPLDASGGKRGRSELPVLGRRLKPPEKNRKQSQFETFY